MIHSDWANTPASQTRTGTVARALPRDRRVHEQGARRGGLQLLVPGAATGSPGGEPVQPLDVRLLDVCEPGAIERPPGLFAVVADRDGDQAAPQRAVTVTYAICSS